MNHNPVGWFEIPVKNLDRAIEFYNSILGVKIEKVDFGGFLMGWFPFDENGLGASGALVQHEEYKPSTEGVLIYFTTQSGDLSIELGKVEKSGGTVLLEKKLISEDIGYMGLFLDTEGNKLALHSRK